ncbi:MAG: hypothetical protein U5K79_03200 [Cyclobacteriaceae bacterium]|nr:hypothetical protein [Cyclobacteriaceae bacterium]
MTDFLYANACLALDMHDFGYACFERLSQMDTPLAPAATWYLAICYISQNELDKATPLLRDLSKMKSSYSVKAEALLGDLEK